METQPAQHLLRKISPRLSGCISLGRFQNAVPLEQIRGKRNFDKTKAKQNDNQDSQQRERQNDGSQSSRFSFPRGRRISTRRIRHVTTFYRCGLPEFKPSPNSPQGKQHPSSRFRSCRPVREQMIQIFNLYPFPFIITFNQFVEYIEIV